MGKSLSDGNIQIQFLNSSRISATVTGKEVSFKNMHLTPHLLKRFCQHALEYFWEPRINHGENDIAKRKSTGVQEVEGVGYLNHRLLIKLFVLPCD